MEGSADLGVERHLEAIGEQVAPGLEQLLIKLKEGAKKALPDELKVRLMLTLEGETNWILASAKAGGEVEIEALWKLGESKSQ